MTSESTRAAPRKSNTWIRISMGGGSVIYSFFDTCLGLLGQIMEYSTCINYKLKSYQPKGLNCYYLFMTS